MSSGEMAQHETPGRLQGRTLAGRYLMQQKIGQGGMGEIYRARHKLIEKTVAVKVLHPERVHHKHALERFQQEARAAARIGNLHIVDVTDYGFTDDGEAFLVMEYLQGQSLAQLLEEQKRLPPRRAVEIARQILDALEAAHEAGIVHRDLKSANVHLVPGGDGVDLVKLLDFGISKILPVEQADEQADGQAAHQAVTTTGIMMGSPHYMAPEQAEECRSVDHRADLYGLGVILYQMLTGELPFGGGNIWNVLLKHATDPPRPPRQLCPELAISDALEQVVLRAMSKDPDDRYPSAAAMLAALDLDHEPDADPAAAQAPPPRGDRNAPWQLALVLSLLIGGAFVASRLANRAEQNTAPAAADAQLVLQAPDVRPPPRPPEAGLDAARPQQDSNLAVTKPRPRPPRPKPKTPPPNKTDLPPNPYDTKK